MENKKFNKGAVTIHCTYYKKEIPKTNLIPFISKLPNTINLNDIFFMVNNKKFSKL